MRVISIQRTTDASKQCRRDVISSLICTFHPILISNSLTHSRVAPCQRYPETFVFEYSRRNQYQFLRTKMPSPCSPHFLAL